MNDFNICGIPEGQECRGTLDCTECQYYNPPKKHGGARAGAGRPKGIHTEIKAPDEKVKKHTLSMTDREWEIFQNNGGTKNLRRYINLGKFRKII